ncbi:hypothetical protein R9X47_02320 [Wukongibacter baidiensis]|uniref:hypothetical protein n=1 Tax=Wukongibacter baidiensis TaxID=1723361 RepID=UPI003D7FC731
MITDKKKAAIEDLARNHLVDRWINELKNIENRYLCSKDEIEEELIDIFDKLCKKTKEMQEKNLKNKIKYIHFSILRTKIMENEGVYRIEFYDEDWYLDEVEAYEFWNADFIYKSLFDHMEELEVKKKKYLRTITSMDIEKIKQVEVSKYHTLACEMVKDMVEKLIELKSFKEIVSEGGYSILFGEYKGDSKVIYQKESD